MATCHHKSDTACPFAFFSEQTEMAQNLGCLPTPGDIVHMRVAHGKTWACHEDASKPCAGAVAHLRQHSFPHKVIDSKLVTLDSDWSVYLPAS